MGNAVGETFTSARGEFYLTEHAVKQMNARRIEREAVLAALSFGRVEHLHGAIFYTIGRNELEKTRADYEGVQVVCDAADGTVITVYRNRNLGRKHPHRRGAGRWRRLPR